MPTVIHRVPIPRGAEVAVSVGDEVTPDHALATRRPPKPPISVPIAAPLRVDGERAGELLVAAPGARVGAGEVLARDDRGREVRSPVTGLMVAYSRLEGAAVVAPLGEETPLVGHVHGRVLRVDDSAVTIQVTAARVAGIEGSGGAVHGELFVGVPEPGEELRAAAIDVGSAAKIVVGGSRASAETLTRARAMGVAGIVLGGILDKELRDFALLQRRRREIGGVSDTFSLLVIEGFGKVGLDPQLFAWLTAHQGHQASLFGDDRQLYVYDASPPPKRHPRPQVGGRVIAHRRPFQGQGGILVEILDDLHAAPSGIATTMALVRFEDGRLAPVPLANLEASGEAAERSAG